MVDKTLYTDDGKPIPWLEKSHETFLNKTTLIFGGSGSGKSRIIDEIMMLCKDHIPVFYISTPSTSNNTYSNRIPIQAKKEDLSKVWLEKFWKSQVERTQLYKIASDINNIKSLFLRINDANANAKIRVLQLTAERHKKAIELNSDMEYGVKICQSKNINELLIKRTVEIYKQTIREYKNFLSEINDLSDNEKITLVYLDLNPNVMLIIDDQTEKFEHWMKYWKKDPDNNVFQCILFKGRHNNITLLVASHDDTFIDTDLRKNARITIFTTEAALLSVVSRTGYSKLDKKHAEKIVKKIFVGGKDNYQRACYIKDDAIPFKYLIANTYNENILLGSKAFWDLCSKIPTSKDKIQDNSLIKEIINNENTDKKRKARQLY